MKLPSLALIGCLALHVTAPGKTAAAGSVYYVSVNGADAGPGSAAQPWRTIGRAVAQVGAGDLVVVQPGTYSEAVVLDRSGADDAPILLRGLSGAVMTSPDPGRSLSAFDVSANVSHIVVQGFELAAGYAETVFVRPGAHHIELTGLHIHHNRTGIWIGGAADVVVRDCVVDHNYRTGIRIFAGARRVRVLDTRSEANDDGLGCDGDSDGFNADDSTADITFERATAIGNSEDGFDVQTPTATVLQAVAQDNGCSGIKMAAGGYLENALVEGNRTGINLNGAPQATTVVQNCTLSQNALGVRALGGGYALVLRNSIVSGPAKALSYAAGIELSEDHNIFFRPLSSDRLIVRTEAGGETRFSGDDINDGTWRRDSGQGEATMALDPRLDPDSCELRSDSAAIDSADPSAFAPLDLAGTPRPVGNAADRGAFESMPSVPTVSLHRATFRADRTGTGLIWLDAELGLPKGVTFDPRLDPVSLAVNGARGEALRVDVPPGAWTVASRSPGTLLHWVRADDSRRVVQLRLGVYGDRTRLWLSARGADLWTVDGALVSVTLQLGRARASAGVTARAVRRTVRK